MIGDLLVGEPLTGPQKEDDPLGCIEPLHGGVDAMKALALLARCLRSLAAVQVGVGRELG